MRFVDWLVPIELLKPKELDCCVMPPDDDPPPPEEKPLPEDLLPLPLPLPLLDPLFDEKIETEKPLVEKLWTQTPSAW